MIRYGTSKGAGKGNKSGTKDMGYARQDAGGRVKGHAAGRRKVHAAKRFKAHARGNPFRNLNVHGSK